MHLTTPFFGTLLAVISVVESKTKTDSAVLLSKVKSLTLYGDRQTSHRRVSPIPQLTCSGGNGCKHYNVDIMRCQNAGSEYDAEDIQWTCSASLPPEFKLGSTGVICEGYDNADDPWILKGSCGVEYRLLLTDEGERKYANQPQSTHKSKQDETRKKTDEDTDGQQSPFAVTLFWLAFIGILCFILYRIFSPPNNNGAIRLDGNNRPGWGGGGGDGGGDHGGDDPPPPYSPQSPPQPRAKPSSFRSSPRNTRNTGAQSGSGFWSGTAAGGAAGYGAGYYHGSRVSEAERRQRERDRERSRERERERERSSSSWLGSGSRYGSGGSGGFFSGSGGGGGGGSPSPSSSRHDSTGFGGTRRR